MDFEQRNKEIYDLFNQGMTQKELGKKFNITPGYISQLCIRQSAMERHLANDELYKYLYDKIIGKCGTGGTVTRIYNALRRYNISTVQGLKDLLEHDDKYIHENLRNLGVRSIRVMRTIEKMEGSERHETYVGSSCNK